MYFINTLITSVLVKLCFITASEPGIIVKIKNGKVFSNTTLQSRNYRINIHAFLGIPFAASPVKEFRFEPPQPVKNWNNLRECNSFGSICTQSESFYNYGPINVIGEEDCLYLNVYTPNVKPDKLLPVLVFVHGGLRVKGDPNDFKPYNWLDQPIVMVTFNYRLGIFGLLSSGDEILPGNIALKDQVAVLEWVQINIKNFGGDPTTVTLMGHSSAAMDVHLHMFSKLSQGLFHRVIILSDSGFSMCSNYHLPKAKILMEKLLCEANCTSQSLNEGIACLRSLDKKTLKKIEIAIAGTKPISILRHVVEPISVERAFLTEDPRTLAYKNPNIPILIGSVSSEGMTFAKDFLIPNSDSEIDDFSKKLTRALPEDLCYEHWVTNTLSLEIVTKQLIDYYTDGRKNIGINELENLFGDIIFKFPVFELSSTYPGKRYHYLYDYKTVHNFTKRNYSISSVGADHIDDLWTMFKTDSSGVKLQISENMIKYVTNFIRIGNPNGEFSGLPEWQEVKSLNTEVLHISENGFRMRTGFISNKSYDLYKSLPLEITRFSFSNNDASSKSFDLIILLFLMFVVVF